MSLEDFISQKLSSLEKKDQYRSLTLYKECLMDFSSNDYLGLAKTKYNFSDLKLSSGSGASRLITANSKLLEELEIDIATWKNSEAALFFGSGYLANLGAISALAGPRDVIFSDEFNHSCILDGIRLSGAKKFFYRNLDYEHLEDLLQKHSSNYANVFVITDSVFSMQGTCADLIQLCDLKKKYNFVLYLDEAHATGVLGQTGAGLYSALVERSKLEASLVDIQMGTFSKACGVEGGYIACNELVKKYLVNFARTFIYSTAPSPYVVYMVKENLGKLIKAKDLRIKLLKNIQYFRSLLIKAELDFTNDETAIFALNFDSNEAVLAKSSMLIEKGFLVKAIRPPTVSKPCLRICLHADHSFDQIDELIGNIMRNF